MSRAPKKGEIWLHRTGKKVRILNHNFSDNVRYKWLEDWSELFPKGTIESLSSYQFHYNFNYNEVVNVINLMEKYGE